jgi:carbon storage regulator
MLVLTRRLHEEIVIAGDIRIRVVAVEGNKVRLGITAPPSVRVDRLEVAQRLAELGPDCDEPIRVPDRNARTNGARGLALLPKK